jgi:hypothetical protein
MIRRYYIMSIYYFRNNFQRGGAKQFGEIVHCDVTTTMADNISMRVVRI